MNKFYLLLLCCISLFKANSQPGSLDSSFGNNGIQKTALFNNVSLLNEEGHVVLTNANGDIFLIVQVDFSNTRIAKYLPDGKLDASYGNAGYSGTASLSVTGAVMQGDKILVAGNTGSDNFTLARYTADGTLDSAFGENGLVTATFNNSNGYASSIALQGNKILVAGQTYTDFNSANDFALARFMDDGAPDSSFGENGKVITDFNADRDIATSLVLREGKIIVAGYTNNADLTTDFALARYTADGMPDSTFGVNGKVTTDFNGSDDYTTSIALQGNNILVAGSSNGNFALACYTADGTLNASFGLNGKVTTNFNSNKYRDAANAIAVQGDKIIVAGYTYNAANDNNDFALACYTANGQLDAAFGKNGKVTTDFGSDDGAYSIALQQGKIILGGYTGTTEVNRDFALARYTATGVLDSTFGKKGKLTGAFPSTSTIFTSTAIQGNKILAAGYAFNTKNSDFAVARYTADGKLDSTFGKNGMVTTDFFSRNDLAYSIVLQGDKIIVAGDAYRRSNDFNDNQSDFALARYTADGVLDSTFGKNGKVVTDFKQYDGATSIALLGDKIVVGGYTSNFPEYDDFALARYTANGNLDSSFGKNGKVTTDFNADYDVVNSIAVQGDKIIAGGYTTSFEEYNPDFALVRYTTDGNLDVTFGKKGRVTTDFHGLDDEATSIAVQGNKIIVGGYTLTDYNRYEDFALVRYTEDGMPDYSFGNKGKVVTDFHNSSDRANSMTLQNDKIIMGGSSDSFGYDNFALARYTTDGNLDSSFGKNGKVLTHLDGSASINQIAVHQNRLYAVGYNNFDPNNTYGIVAAYQLEAPEPTISIADVTVLESKKLAIVTVRLSKPANKLVRVHFTTRDKTAVHNEDYLPISGPLFFIPGVNVIAKIFIPILDDNTTEGDEQFEIVLSDAHNASIQDSIGVVTIVDDDAAPIAKQNTSLHIHVSPNPSANVFTVQLQGNNLKQRVSVRVYDVSGKLIEQRENISIGQSFRLGEQYKAGTYIIEAVQGTQRLQTKAIKTGK